MPLENPKFRKVNRYISLYLFLVFWKTASDIGLSQKYSEGQYGHRPAFKELRDRQEADICK